MDVIFGPPGTGKTTELGRLVRQYAEEEGSETLLLCAFTKTAAQEMAGRGLGLARHQIGTIHSHCFHGLDEPPIAELHYKVWNAARRGYTLSAPDAIEESVLSSNEGDKWLSYCHLRRHRFIHVSEWHPIAQIFWRKWVEWKFDNGYCDYTDLLEKALVLLPIAPGNPRTIIVDEAQDLSLLQWKLLDQWARHAWRFIAAGDDDQCLYRWAGADVSPLLGATSRRVLPQSYRVPQTIQAVAMRCARHVHRRHEKTWAPRPQQGTYSPTAGTWRHPHVWITKITQWLEEPWGSYAFLAPCSYMLTPLIMELREAGIPFANPWRKKRHDWNPLLPSQRGISTLQRVHDFLRPPDRLWTWQECATWIPLLESDRALHHGTKAMLTHKADMTQQCTLDDMATMLLPERLQGALHGGIAWLYTYALQAKKQTIAYHMRITQRYGIEALTAEPRVFLGNIHSFKGAEADTVTLFTALSRKQQLACRFGGDDKDDIYRMLYVGITRAKETLYLVNDRRGNVI